MLGALGSVVDMAIATKSQYWNARMRGADPSVATTGEDVWAGGSGSANGGDWVITNGTWSITPAAEDNDMTLLACFSYTTAPDDDAVLLKLSNGSHKIEVKSDGTTTGLKIVGASTVTFSDLDLNVSGSEAVPIMIRLTLASDGSARCYRYEIEENDDAVDDFKSLTGASTSDNVVSFGNTSGSIKWHSVYYSKFGSFGPKELMGADFAQDIHVRMALSIIQHLKDSNRPYLKTQVDDANIVFAYDISPSSLRTMQTPSIHIYVEDIASPEFTALGGSAIDQVYSAEIFVTTKGTTYQNAYLLALNILGEIFDELYTSTGLSGTTDSLESHECKLDTRVDDDEITCTHQLTLTYKRRIKMTRR